MCGLATISVAHLYNLRHHQRYRERLLNYTKTRPLRFPSVSAQASATRPAGAFCAWTRMHQGDQPDAKGVYHINAVDEVTQWRWPVQRRAFRKPILSRFWRICCVSFRFASWASHRQRSECHLHMTVAELLEKLRVEQTKRPPAERRQRLGGDQKRRCHSQHTSAMDTSTRAMRTASTTSTRNT